MYLKNLANDTESTIKLNNNKTETFYPTTDFIDFPAAKLSVNSKKVYDEKLDLGDGTRVCIYIIIIK